MGRVGHSVRAASRVKLVDEGAEMELGGVNRDPELAGDGLVGSPLREKLKDLQFARRQPYVGVYWTRVLRQDQSDVGFLARGGQPHTGKVGKQGGQSIRKVGSLTSTAIKIDDGASFSFTFRVSPICSSPR
jgi:hypothetical protein